MGGVGQGNGLGQADMQADLWAQFLHNQTIQQQQQQQQAQTQPVGPMTEAEALRRGARVPSVHSNLSSSDFRPVVNPNMDVLTQMSPLISQMTLSKHRQQLLH